QRDLVGVFTDVKGTGPNCVEAYGDFFGLDFAVIAPGSDTHDGLNQIQADVEVFQVFAFVGGAPDIGVSGVRFFGGVTVWVAAFDQPLGHFLTTAELFDEFRVQPRLVNLQVRVGHQTVTVEPLDIVALVGRAVAPDVHAVVFHSANQQGSGHSTAKRRGVEVCFAS